MRVLVVDDDRNIRLMLKECLEQEDYSIDEAETGEQALEKLASAKEPYGAVLLDMKMPGMGGIEALKRMKQMDPALQVIMITAYGTVETAVEAMKLGAVDYLRKPFSAKDVRSLVKQVTSREALSTEAVERRVRSTEATRFEKISAIKSLLVNGNTDTAMELLQEMVGQHADDPEAFNLLGLLMEVKGDMLAAQRMYRAALSLDPTYEPARENLANTTEVKYRSQNISKIK